MAFLDELSDNFNGAHLEIGTFNKKCVGENTGHIAFLDDGTREKQSQKISFNGIHYEDHTYGERVFRTDNQKPRNDLHTNGKTFKCRFCGVCCDTFNDLKKHTLVHAGQKAYKCVYCDCRFKTPVELATHALMHIGEKPGKCDACDNSSTDAKLIKKHKFKPFKCDKCDYSCARSDYLKTHKLIHTDEKKFICEICGSRYRTSGNLRQHQKRKQTCGGKLNTKSGEIVKHTSKSVGFEIGETTALNAVDIEKQVDYYEHNGALVGLISKEGEDPDENLDKDDSVSSGNKETQSPEITLHKCGSVASENRETQPSNMVSMEAKPDSDDFSDGWSGEMASYDWVGVVNDSAVCSIEFTVGEIVEIIGMVAPDNVCLVQEDDGYDFNGARDGDIWQHEQADVQESLDTRESLNIQDGMVNAQDNALVNDKMDDAALDGENVMPTESQNHQVQDIADVNDKIVNAMPNGENVVRTKSQNRYANSKIEEKTFRCRYCGVYCENYNDLKKHTVVHAGQRTYKCVHCDSEFETPNKLALHVVLHTAERSNETSYKLKCYECGYETTKLTDLSRHMENKHGGGKPYKCDVCNYSTYELRRIRQHKWMHMGDKPYMCDLCDYCTRRPGSLKAHKMMHTGERPYMCEICGFSTTRSDSLRDHKRRHTEEKTYACDVCGKRYKTSSNLGSHRRMAHNRDVRKNNFV